MSSHSLEVLLQELTLIRSTLFPDEHFTFLPPELSQAWEQLLKSHEDDPDATLDLPTSFESSSAQFRITISGCPIWIDIELPRPDSVDGNLPLVSLRARDVKRDEQETLQTALVDTLKDLAGTEFVAYQVLCLHLLPMLHEKYDDWEITQSMPDVASGSEHVDEPHFHALLTSHHLISSKKRRSLQQWTAELSLSGFAKVGYPGAIYCEGQYSAVEDFVGRVKAMQWLGLRVRFVEQLSTQPPTSRKWEELTKVGEILSEMRKLGRESIFLNLGIGSCPNSIESLEQSNNPER